LKRPAYTFENEMANVTKITKKNITLVVNLIFNFNILG